MPFPTIIGVPIVFLVLFKIARAQNQDMNIYSNQKYVDEIRISKLTVSRTEAESSTLECSFGTLATSSASFLAATPDQLMARIRSFRESGPEWLPSI